MRGKDVAGRRGLPVDRIDKQQQHAADETDGAETRRDNNKMFFIV
ncbi:hypothetical protein [Gemmatimonas aurantiaca]